MKGPPRPRSSFTPSHSSASNPTSSTRSHERPKTHILERKSPATSSRPLQALPQRPIHIGREGPDPPTAGVQLKIWAEAKGTGHVAVDVDGETYVSNVPDRRKESTLAGTGDLRVGPEGELKKGVNIYEKPSQIPRTRKDDDEAFTKKVGPPVVINFGSTIFQGNVIRDQTQDMQANGLTYRIAPSKSTDKEGKETYLPPSNCISTSKNVLGNSANQEHKDVFFSTMGNTDKMQTTEFLKAAVTFAGKVGATVHYPETAKSSEGGATAPTSSPPSGGGSSSDGGGGGSSSGGGGGGGGGGTE